MGKYFAYSDYCETDIEWLGKIPRHWSMQRLKFIFDIKKRIAGTLGFDVLSVTQRGIQVKNIESGEGQLSMDYSKYQLVNVGDFAMNHMDLLTGYIDISKFNGVTSPDYRVFSINDEKKYDKRYYLYLLQMGYKQRLFFHLGQGSAHLGRWRLPTEAFNEIRYPVPHTEEQTQIANFLDHETAKIDTLIEKQQQLIKLLKEKRQAVISHAVTKGLNPQAPMKDSGVEWLGEVPEHWVVSRLGFHTLKIGSGKTPKGGAEVYQKEGVLFLRSQNVYDDGLRISESESVYISESIHDEMRTTKVFGGDILLNITGGSIGRTCLVPLEFIEANVNQHVCIIRLPDCLREFISMVLKSTPIKEQIGAIQTGGNREGLNFEQISKFSFALPPESERGEIVQSVKISLAKLDALEEQSNRAIKLMQERRTALISAAVTGKIDVCNWQAPTHQALEQTA
ncbi:restriction endonuclease subunit S [Vibrio parahaemolyticus]|uniref:restriction endonuclease subunit S n=1 Tax=Vibrio parahaemolyticus TaxID=670 RepID=UPI0027E4D0A5|nr:restriction endonuclease subunit S [Vibrio parahaemolyticus]WMN95559.1 restriction endonuclease subunit S [Vibrio parahaemolyticus]